MSPRRFSSLESLTLLSCALVLGSIGRGARAEPWVAPGDVPLAPWVRGVRVKPREVPLRLDSDSLAARRGTATPGAVLPIFGLRKGPGCAGRWVLVGASAWACDRDLVVTRQFSTAGRPATSNADGLPYQYYFVGRDGSLAYSRLEAADETAPDRELEPGFSVAARQRARRGSEVYVESTDGFWIPLRDLTPITAPRFQGLELGDSLDVGWVWTEGAPTFTRPGGAKNGSLPRQTLVPILERSERSGAVWYRVAESAWVRAATTRALAKTTPPPELRQNERWIDVDLSEQILTAYEGERPVFATLVSTGRDREGGAEATPLGLHRIWVKVVSINMDNLENQEASRYYSMQAVPWVMFFKDGFGLHGTYWHSSFGQTRSAGCVNLAPRDAEWLFRFASPHLPANWSAVHPTEYELGTLVQIRESLGSPKKSTEHRR